MKEPGGTRTLRPAPVTDGFPVYYYLLIVGIIFVDLLVIVC